MPRNHRRSRSREDRHRDDRHDRDNRRRRDSERLSVEDRDRGERHRRRHRRDADSGELSRRYEWGEQTHEGQRRCEERDDHRRSQPNASDDEKNSPEKIEKPTMALSGILAAETNKVNGTVLKYTEPPEAKLPETRWRMYVFKNGEMHDDPLPMHRQTCFLFGRDRNVCDIPTDHPSCSKQHCVLQYRCVGIENPIDGSLDQVVKPYLMDLESVNGTFINKQRMESRRYYEILEQDTVRLGSSSREYVFLRETDGTG